MTGGALEITQLGVQAEAITSATQNTMTAANTTVSAAADTALLTKENMLDGIGWAIAKQMVSSMTQSMINWINSGFQGSPAFITDLQQHLTNALDQVAGEYISSLGGIGEFICSPFQLDVQAALAVSYEQSRSGMPSGPTACTLTDIENNITNFLDGTSSGWGQWFEVTSNPQNTPYGAYLAAEASLNARLSNTAGQEVTMSLWGDGFLSSKVCEDEVNQTNCTITTPGQVISEALTFQLSTGPQALIEADEINEIIGALMNQLMNQALQGVNGLLGLGGSSSYTSDYDNDPSNGTQSYVDQMVTENLGLSSTSTDDTLNDQLDLENEMVALADETIRLGNEALSNNLVSNTSGSYSSSPIEEVIRDAEATREQALANIETVESLLTEFNDAAATLRQPNLSENQQRNALEQQESVINEYLELLSDGDLTTESQLAMKEVEWGRVLSEEAIDDMVPVSANIYSSYEHLFFPTLSNLLTPPSTERTLAFSSTAAASGCSGIVGRLESDNTNNRDNAYRVTESTCSLYPSSNTNQVTVAETSLPAGAHVVHTHGDTISFADIGGPTVNKGDLGPTGLDFVNYCHMIIANPSLEERMFVYANSGQIWSYSVSRSRCQNMIGTDTNIKSYLMEATAYDICRIYQVGGGSYNKDKFSESYFASVTNQLYPGREWDVTDADDPVEETYIELIEGSAQLDADNYSSQALSDCIADASSALQVTVTQYSGSTADDQFCSLICSN